MKHALLALWIAALLGCAQATIGTDAAPLVFDYGAFDLSFQLTLRPDRTYTETEIGPLVTLNAKGERPPPAVREQGTYGIDGDRVVLYPQSGGRRILRRIDGAKTLLREEVRGSAHDYVQEPNRPAKTTS